MKVLVCDDEPLARERLVRLLAELGVDTVVEAHNGSVAIEWVSRCQPDLILLDIEMPVMNGLEVAQRLLQEERHETVMPAILFCTAYDRYALEAFKVNAINYLLKPVRKEVLAEALLRCQRVNRAQLERLTSELSGALPGAVSAVHPAFGSSEASSGKYIRVKTTKGIERILVETVRYFKAEQKYVLMRTTNEEILVDETLKELEAKFTEAFVRIHRNALVAVNHVELLEQGARGQWCVKLFDVPEPLQVSRRHRASLKKRIQSLQE